MCVCVWGGGGLWLCVCVLCLGVLCGGGECMWVCGCCFSVVFLYTVLHVPVLCYCNEFVF